MIGIWIVIQSMILCFFCVRVLEAVRAYLLAEMKQEGTHKKIILQKDALQTKEEKMQEIMLENIENYGTKRAQKDVE